MEDFNIIDVTKQFTESEVELDVASFNEKTVNIFKKDDNGYYAVGCPNEYVNLQSEGFTMYYFKRWKDVVCFMDNKFKIKIK